MRSQSTGIRREVIDALIVESGLPTEDLSGWTKVLAIDQSQKRLLVPKTRQIRRIDLAGFIPPTHPGIIRLTDEESRKISARVKGQIDFTKPEPTIREAIGLALSILSGHVPVEALPVTNKLAAPPSLSDFVEPAERTRSIEFFAAVSQAALAAASDNAEFAPHLKYILDKCIWGVTTCSDRHKHNTRYVSMAVRNLILDWERAHREGRAFSKEGFKQTNAKLFRKLVIHEHVVTREALVQKLRTSLQEQLPEVLRGAIACLVTVSESKQLGHASEESWDRYDAEEIEVWDRQLGRPIGAGYAETMD